MVKKRHWRISATRASSAIAAAAGDSEEAGRRKLPGARAIPEVRFDQGKARRLGVETLGLRELIAREAPQDLRRPQRPTFHLLFLVTEGRGEHRVDFRRCRLSAGAVLHVAPGQVQQFTLAPSLEARLIVFQPDFVRRAPLAWPGTRMLPPRRHATVAALFEAVAREHAAFDGSAAGRRLLSSLMDTLLLAVEDPATASVPSSGGEPLPLMMRFEAAVERSFARAHEVAAYAAVLDCSPRTLARLCRRASGRSAKRVIDERVALEAKRLLAHGTDPAAEISGQLGFAEPTQFGKFFRRLVGETPAAFRARFAAKATS